MTEEFMTDHQRAEQIRGWVRENWWVVLGGVALGFAGLFGWQQYQKLTSEDAERASAVYEQLFVALRADDTARADELEAQLGKNHASSPYLDQARLLLVRLHIERGEFDKAAEKLRQVMDSGRGDEVRMVARMRLARVLAEQEKPEEALRLLDVPKDSGFAPRVHEQRGDLLAALGRATEARTEYLEALKSDDPLVVDRALVQAKLDDLGLADTPAPAVAGAPAGEAAPAKAAEPAPKS